MGTLKHDIRRETSLNEFASHNDGNLPSQLPTPSDIMIAREQWNRLLRDQPSHYQEIIHLRFRGETLTAIADRLDINERTVRRVLSQLFEDRVA